MYPSRRSSAYAASARYHFYTSGSMFNPSKIRSIMLICPRGFYRVLHMSFVYELWTPMLRVAFTSYRARPRACPRSLGAGPVGGIPAFRFARAYYLFAQRQIVWNYNKLIVWYTCCGGRANVFWLTEISHVAMQHSDAVTHLYLVRQYIFFLFGA